MMLAHTAVQTLVDTLPDVPRWVEARGMLLSGRGRIVAGPGATPGCLVSAEGDRLAVLVGRPDADAVRAALLDSPASVLAAAEDTGVLQTAVPGWIRAGVTLHTLSGASSGSPRDPVPDAGVRLLGPDDDRLLPHVPAALRTEIMRALRFSPVAASFEGERPVSFCYAAWQTEGWWDVAVDTLEPYRGRGHAARAARLLIAEMARWGRQPVWGALDGNDASLRAARRLGFSPADRLFLWSPPPA